MEKGELRILFESEYPGKKAIFEKLIQPIFKKAKDTTLSNEIDITEGDKKQIKSFSIIAQVRGGFPIAFADVEVQDSVALKRSRVTIQNCVRKMMENDSNAIIFFHFSDDKSEWRVSFCHRADKLKESTNAKRFTYLCGTEHACRTIAERFETLKGLSTIKDEDLLEAFSVEPLSKEFFDEYREHYADLVEYISGKRFVKKGGKFVEEKTKNAAGAFREAFGDDDKKVRDFVKKMMGRLVFLQFLQKKGWLGVQENAEWGSGDKNFIYNLFKNASKDVQNDFLEKALEPLFFKSLNQKRDEKALAPEELCDIYGSKIRIPYLNGGLFEADELDKKKVKFKKEHFDQLLTFFNQYNFTIDETDGDDQEIGVDPEMLGKIFENLLEDNKDKGAFYTPKEIVQYMCRESLIAYLQERSLNEENRSLGEEKRSLSEVEMNGDSTTLSTRIRNFVLHHAVSDFSEGEKAALLKALLDVKICDPAVGSGAFPMGMMNELLSCTQVLTGNAKSRSDLKKHIVKNNIYGVDIEKGAVDIARLRFWLAIIVDEKEPLPLPNLDYKIMQGNSLLESFNGIDLSNLCKEDESTLFDGNDEIKTLLEYMKTYFDKHEEKLAVRDEIKETVLGLLKARLVPPEVIAKLKQLDLHENSEFFLWHTWFGDVFNRPNDRNGFDIVIGNPPYGAKLSDAEKKIFKKSFKSAQTVKNIQKGSLDTFSLFIEHGFNIISKNGIASFIIPLSITSSDSMEGLHKILIENCDSIFVSSYGDRPRRIFESAEQQVSIIQFKKTYSPATKVYTTCINKRYADESINKMLKNLHFVNSFEFVRNGRIPKIGTENERIILEKLLKHSDCIGSQIIKNGKPIFYRKAGGRYYKVITTQATGSSAEGSIVVSEKYQKVAAAILSTTLFYWFWLIHSDWHNLRSMELSWFPFPSEKLSDKNIEKINKLYDSYSEDLIRNSKTTSTGLTCYFARKSKNLIDQLDDLICPLYGLTKEETEFIKNYEIEFRVKDEE